MRPLHNRGFSLIELMVILVIVVILILLSIPNLSGWIQNGKTRAVAESLQNDLRLAQTEALRLNRFTTFTSTSTDWTVDYIANSVNPLADTLTHPLQKSPTGSFTGTIITPNAANPAVLEFSNLGRVSGAATAAGPFTPLGSDAIFDVTNSSGPRKLRVLVSSSGKVRMCDPDAGGYSTSRPDGC